MDSLVACEGKVSQYHEGYLEKPLKAWINPVTENFIQEDITKLQEMNKKWLLYFKKEKIWILEWQIQHTNTTGEHSNIHHSGR